MITNCYFASLLSVTCLTLTQFTSSAAEPEKKIPVTTKSLNNTHQLIGPLGKPLGEVFIVDLIASNRNKSNKRFFEDYVTITSIDQKSLQKPIEMPARLWNKSDIKELTQDSHYRVKVYQDAGTIGIPIEARKETDIPLQTCEFAFVCWIVIVKTVPESK